MAQIQRKQKIEDTLELLDENGVICHTLPVNIDIDRCFVRVAQARKNIIAAEQELKKENTPKAHENYGKAICELYSAIFGDEGCDKILEHYDNRYTDMFLDIMPYLINEIYPRFDAISKAKVQQLIDLKSAVDPRKRTGKHSRGRTFRKR